MLTTHKRTVRSRLLMLVTLMKPNSSWRLASIVSMPGCCTTTCIKWQQNEDPSLSCQASACSLSAFHSIRSISRIRKFLSMESAKTLVHAFVTSKLVNCNALLYGLPKYHIQRLQYTLNSDARLVTLSQKHDHISPVLMELHQLPVEQRVGLKILSFSPRVVNGWHLFISGIYL